MKFNSLRPMLWSAQFDETIAFYTGLLGFTLDARNDDWGWASLSKDDVGIMIARPNEHAAFEMPVFTGSIYINTDDVVSIWDELKDKATLVYGLEDFPWEMREFAIYDNNGYILQFGQDISEPN
jgi:uncharacterized glyoxalase superfamily protein PhnB